MKIDMMVAEEGEDLAAMSHTGESRSEEIITDSEDSDDMIALLRDRRVCPIYFYI